MKVLSESKTGFVLEASYDEYEALNKLSSLLDGRLFSEQYHLNRSLMPFTDLSSAFDWIIHWVMLAQKAEELRHAADRLDEALQRRHQ